MAGIGLIDMIDEVVKVFFYLSGYCYGTLRNSALAKVARAGWLLPYGHTYYIVSIFS